MRYVRFCGFSGSPWREMALAVRLRRLAANKGVTLKRAQPGSSFMDQLAAVADEDYLVVGYQPAILGIAGALSHGKDPYASLALWRLERDGLVKALSERAERTIAFSINSASTNPSGFVQRLAIRTGLEFSYSRSVRLPELDLLDRYIAEQIVIEKDARFEHLELDYSSLVPAESVGCVPQEQVTQAILHARQGRAQLGDDIDAFKASLLAATGASDEFASHVRTLRRSRLARRKDVHGDFAESIIETLKARYKRIRVLEADERSLADKLEVLQAKLDERTNCDSVMFDDSEGNSAKSVSLNGPDVLGEILEASRDEVSRRDEEIDLLRDLLAEGLELGTLSASPVHENRGSKKRADVEGVYCDVSQDDHSSVELSGVPGHVVVSRKSRRDPLFWFQTARDYWLLKGSHLFEADWYLQRYPELAQKRWDPVLHYLLYGGREGRPASRYFCSAQYLHYNPEVVEKGLNPLVHYLRFGRAEMRQTYRPNV